MTKKSEIETIIFNTLDELKYISIGKMDLAMLVVVVAYRAYDKGKAEGLHQTKILQN